MSIGNINPNLAFVYGDKVMASYGCGATLNGEFWYFGGWNRYKNVSLSLVGFRIYNIFFTFFQSVSKVVGCQLARQQDLAFDLSRPACNTFLESTPKVLLCFDMDNDKACFS